MQTNPANPQPVARLMLGAFRLFEQQLIHLLQADGFTDISLHHLNLLRHLNPEGMRLIDLARDAGITKQAAGQFCQVLSNTGYVLTSPDPSDKRAKIVTYTARGKAFLAAAYEHVHQIESNAQAYMGKERFSCLQNGLNDYINSLANNLESK